MPPATSQTEASRQPGASLQPVAILPARLGSTRLPRKLLLAETGTPLVVHTARRVRECSSFVRVLVATDDEQILAAVQDAGMEAVMTSSAHPSGTDRVREAALTLDPDLEPVVNVQADEPEIDPLALQGLLALFDDPQVEIATLCAPIEAPSEQADTSVVKVVRDAQGDALYFSRAAIPDASHERAPGGPSTRGQSSPRTRPWAWRHVGVYAFRRAALERFCELPPSPLEERENLEQLRWLEAGGRMRVLPIEEAPHGIDTSRDYEAFVARQAAAEPHASG